MQRENGCGSPSSAVYRDCDPFVYVCRSSPACEEAVLCRCDQKLHVCEEGAESPLRHQPESAHGRKESRSRSTCPREDRDWVTVSPTGCYNSCKCGALSQTAIFPEPMIPSSGRDMCGMNGQTRKCYLQRTSMFEVEDRGPGKYIRPYPLCNLSGCARPHDCTGSRSLTGSEHPREAAASAPKMKGGCSMFGLGARRDEESTGGCREMCGQGRCSSPCDDLYVREKDDLGTTCLSYKPSVLQSGMLASAEDFCTSSMPQQKPGRCDGGHCSHGGGCSERRVPARTGRQQCGGGGGGVCLGCGGKLASCAPFPRGDTSWLSASTQSKLKECPARRPHRNKCFLQRHQKQEAECEHSSPEHIFREDSSWLNGQLPCQHQCCKRCKSQPTPERALCSQCSDDNNSLMSIRQGDCHASNCRNNGTSAPIMCSLPQWPRHLLMQNSGAQATTTVYKD
ncbi:uncharacterized protein LOC144604612 isoform X2 [Rhinoraja longicauda]